MKSVVVSKTGMVLNTPSVAKQTSTSGEIGETLGLLCALVDAGHRVVYFGKVRGKLPDGVEHCVPNPGTIDRDDTWKSQLEMMRRNADTLAKVDPAVFVDMAGISQNFTMVDGYSPLLSAIRYLSPVLGAVGELGLRRVSIVTDIRSTPRESEMATLYPTLRPVAVLSQLECNKQRTLHGVRLSTRHVRTDTHSWWMRAGWRRPNYVPIKERHWDGSMIMHSHLGEYTLTDVGWRTKGNDGYNRPFARQAAYTQLFGGRDGLTSLNMDFRFRFVGTGWEYMTFETAQSLEYACTTLPDLFKPLIPINELFNAFADSVCAPMIVPMHRGWRMSAKASMAAWSWCVPVFYGRGDVDFSYDPLGEYVPLDSQMRAAERGDLQRILRELRSWSDDQLRDYTERMCDALRPTFSDVLECIERLLRDERTDTDDWWERFGGYRVS